MKKEPWIVIYFEKETFVDGKWKMQFYYRGFLFLNWNGLYLWATVEQFYNVAINQIYAVVPNSWNGFSMEKLQTNYIVPMELGELLWGVVWKVGKQWGIGGDSGKS